MFQMSNEATPHILQLPIPATLDARGLTGRDFLFDFRLAIAVQRRMLPRSSQQLRTIAYAATSTAARGLGGDYYDFLELAPGLLGFLLADVSGKGVAAALLMANLQATIRCECARACGDLGAMLQGANAHFFASTLPEHYATLFFGQYDDRARKLSYVNCGQPAIIRRHDGSIERLEATALPLGLARHWTGEKKTVELWRGDTLWVYSDGVIEAGIENGYELGEDGLIAAIAANPDQDVDLAVARIAYAVDSCVAGEASDDMTIVGIRAL